MLNQQIVDTLDLFRGHADQDRFQDKLVIVLIVVPGNQRLFLHERHDCFVVIVHDGVFAGMDIREHKYPIESENLTVKHIQIIQYWYHPAYHFPSELPVCWNQAPIFRSKPPIKIVYGMTVCVKSCWRVLIPFQEQGPQIGIGFPQQA